MDLVLIAAKAGKLISADFTDFIFRSKTLVWCANQKWKSWQVTQTWSKTCLKRKSNQIYWWLEMKQSKTHDGRGQWDSFEFQSTSDKRALNGTLCNGCGAINTEVVRADILHLMASEVPTWQPGSTECRSLKHMGLHSRGHNVHQQLPKHTHSHGHHTTCLCFCTDKSAGRSTHTWVLKKAFLPLPAPSGFHPPFSWCPPWSARSTCQSNRTAGGGSW